MRFITLAGACALALLAGCSRPAPAPETTPEKAPEKAPAAIVPAKVDLPAGTYRIDPAHSSLIFRVNHIGMSNYTARFTRFDSTLAFDPVRPQASRLDTTVQVKSLETDNYDKSYDFNAMLTGRDWLDAGRFPTITFRSTRIDLTGPKTARITGDLTLKGITRPVVLNASFNGGYASHPLDPGGSRMGFSAHGTLKRSDYGLSFGVPEPGSTLGVGDTVEVIIETEFLRPLDKPTAAPATGH